MQSIQARTVLEKKVQLAKDCNTLLKENLTKKQKWM